MGTPAPFDWKSLITPAVALGSKVVGDAVAPSPELQAVRQSGQQQAFDRDITLRKMANANAVRGSIMPGMYTSLGYSPQQGQQLSTNYQATANSPGAFTGTLPSKSPGVGSTIGRAALGAGINAAPAIIGGLLKKSAPVVGATVPSAGGGILGTLGSLATNPITIGAAAVGLGAYIWKKSQAHPVADEWVHGEQNPFDQHWKQLQASGLPPQQLQQAEQQSAQNYLTELAKFASEGGKNMEVARNAARTFRQFYGDPMKYGIQLPF